MTDQDEKNLEERSDIKSEPVDEYVDDFTGSHQESSNSDTDFAKVSIS